MLVDMSPINRSAAAPGSDHWEWSSQGLFFKLSCSYKRWCHHPRMVPSDQCGIPRIRIIECWLGRLDWLGGAVLSSSLFLPSLQRGPVDDDLIPDPGGEVPQQCFR